MKRKQSWIRGALALVMLGAMGGCEADRLAGPAADAAARHGKGPSIAGGGSNKLDTPQNVSYVFDGDDIVVSWDAVANAAQYHVVFGNDAPIAAQWTSATSVRVDVSGVDFSGGTYCVKVAAHPTPGAGYQPSHFSECVAILPASCAAWDVKPGNGTEVDPLNLTDPTSALIPVAIFGSASLDVATIDVASIRFGDTSTPLTGVALKNNGTFHAAIEHVDDDGDGYADDAHLDLVLKFSRPDLIASGDVDGSTAAMYLVAAFSGGGAVTLCNPDAVRIVP